jgi:hypothetical protein
LHETLIKLYFCITYLFMTYIVTSKPKRISVTVGLVHMVYSPFFEFIVALYAYVCFTTTVKPLERTV